MHGMIRPIGIPERRENLERLGADFAISKQALQIGECIWLIGEIPRIMGYENPENHLLIMDPIKMVDPLPRRPGACFENEERAAYHPGMRPCRPHKYH
jgi:hypothetical protein